MKPPRKNICLPVLISSVFTKINLIFLVIFFLWPLLGMTRVRPHFVSLLVRVLKVKNDHRSKFSNLSNWKEEPEKKSGLQRDSNP